MKSELKNLPKSEVEITIELTAEEFAQHIDKALEHLKSHVKMDGFRQGQVPKDMVEKKVGNENVLMEAGDLAVKEAYTKFVNEHGLEPIGDPDVQIKKIAKGSEMVFTVKVAVLPEVELPDYKKIAAETKGQDVAVEPNEIDEELNYLQRSRAKFTDKTEGAAKKDYIKIEYTSEHINAGKPVNDIFILGEGGFLKDFEDNLLGMKTDDEKEFTAKFPENAPKELAGKEGKFNVKMLAVQNMALPEITEEFAKGLGAFENVAALKENIKEGIALEKQDAEKQRKRSEVLSKIAKETDFNLPEKMVESEQIRLFEDLKNQVAAQFNIPFEQYLASVKKTEEEIKAGYKLEAEKRIKNFLVLRQIGKVENIAVSNEELEQEMNKAVARYGKEQAAKIDINRLKEYTKGAIFNEKVFSLLENLSNPK
ncbi:MAG TPA: trigger factor [Negativicutes bacterium]|nr:trigger factor [Negativicutes bacterium]